MFIYSCKKEVKEMAKEKECCDIKIFEKKDGVKIDISGKDLKKCLEACLKNCCGKE
jgi:hypothetical protein